MGFTEKGSAANRALSALLAVVLAIGLMPLPAYAATATPAEGTPASEGATPAEETPAANSTAAGGEDPVGTLTERPAAEGGTTQPEDDPGTASTPADPDQQRRDEEFTAGWESGAWVISEPGIYKLTRDITTPGMLTIAAPAGQAITLDFDGHTATVAGEVFAGIDAGASLGGVAITDSAYEKRAAEARAEGQDAPAPKANLVVEGYKATTAIVGVQANYAQLGDEQKANPAVAGAKPALSIRGVGISATAMTADASAPADATFDAYAVYAGLADEGDPRGGVDVELSDVELSAEVADIALTEAEAARLRDERGEAAIGAGRSGTAVAVFASAPGVALSGRVATSLRSAGGTCDVYSTVDAPLVLEGGFETPAPLAVLADGNAEGACLALVGGSFGDPAAAEALLADAAGGGLAPRAEGSRIVLRDPADAPGAGAPAEDGGDAPSPESAEPARLAIASTVMSILSSPAEMTAQEEKVIEIDQSKWNTETANSTKNYVLTESATYKITGDIDMGNYAFQVGRAKDSKNKIDAVTHVDAVIDLNGCTLTTSQTDAKDTSRYGIIWGYAAALTGSVTIKGGVAENGKRGKLVCNTSSTSYTNQAAITWTSTKDFSYTLEGVDIKLNAKQITVTSAVSVYGVKETAFRGKATIKDCTITVDASQVSARNKGNDSYYGYSAVSKGDHDIEGLTVNVKVGENSLAAAYGIGCGADTPTADNNALAGTAVNVTGRAGRGAYGLYQPKWTVKDIEGNKGLAVSVASAGDSYAIGGATATYASVLDGTVSLKAATTGEGASALGFSTTDTTGASLKLGDSFNYTATRGSGESAQTYDESIKTAVVSGGTTNEGGWRLASVSGSKKGTDFATSFSSAADYSEVGGDDAGLYFDLKTNSSAVSYEVLDSSNTTVGRYIGSASAVAKAKETDDPTVKLVGSAEAYSITTAAAGEGKTLNIDLNGHALGALTVAKDNAGTVKVRDDSSNKAGSVGAVTVNAGELALPGVKVTGTLTTATGAKKVSLTDNALASGTVDHKSGALVVNGSSIVGELDKAGPLVKVSGSETGSLKPTLELYGATVKATSKGGVAVQAINIAMNYNNTAKQYGETGITVKDSAVEAVGSGAGAAHALLFGSSNGGSVCELAATSSEFKASNTSGDAVAVSDLSAANNAYRDYATWSFGGCSLTATVAASAESETASGNAVGLQVRGYRASATDIVTPSVTLKGAKDSGPTVKASAQNGKAVGVWTGGHADILLDGASLDASSAAEGKALAFEDAPTSNNYTETAALTLAGTFKATGTLSFTTSDSVANEPVLRLAPDFSPQSGIAVRHGEWIFAQSVAKGSEGEEGYTAAKDLTAEVAGKFKGTADNGTFANATGAVAASDKTHLRWSVSEGQAEVRNDTQGMNVPRMADALATMQSGDTLKLLKDLTYGDGWKINVAAPEDGGNFQLTFDLNGHTLTAGGKATARATKADEATTVRNAIEVAGPDTVTFKDTAEAKGRLKLYAGTNFGSTNSAVTTVVAGLNASGVGAVAVLDGAAADVVIWGGAPAATESAYGAGAVASGAGSKVALKGASELRVSQDNSLDVESGAAICDFPFYRLAGLYASAADGAIAVEKGAKVAVSETLATVTEAGALDKAGGATESTDNVWNVIQVFPEKGSAFFEEARALFKERAVFDGRDWATGDQIGEKYGWGNRVYWMCERLADGTKVWAFSERVEEGAEGLDESIEPAYFFVQTRVDVLGSAYGIATGSAFGGKVDVSGSVAAKSSNGNAYGVYMGNADAGKTATCTIGNGSEIEAKTSQNGLFRQAGSADLNVTNVIAGLEPGANAGRYPRESGGNSSIVMHYRLAQNARAGAYGVCIGTASTGQGALNKVVLDGEVDVRAEGGQAVGVRLPGPDDPLYVTGRFKVADAAKRISVLMAAAGDAGNTLAQTFAKGQGDHVPTDAQAASFADANADLSSSKGEDGVEWSGGIDVSFYAGGSLVERHEGLSSGDQVALPGAAQLKKEDESGNYDYVFKGWAFNDPDATSVDAEGKDIAADAGVLAVTETAAYYAVYAKVPKTAAVRVYGVPKVEHGKASTGEDGEVQFADAVEFTAVNGETVAESMLAAAGAAEAIAALAAPVEYTVGDGESAKRYVLVGWASLTATNDSASDGTGYEYRNGFDALFDPVKIASEKVDLSAGSTGSGVAVNWRTTELRPVYKEVGANDVVVRFKAEDRVTTWVGPKGTQLVNDDGYMAVSDYKQKSGDAAFIVRLGSDSSVTKNFPTKSGTGVRYMFRGWSADPNADSSYAGKADVAYAFSHDNVSEGHYTAPFLPAANADATYVAKFEAEKNKVVVHLHTMSKGSGGTYAYPANESAAITMDAALGRTVYYGDDGLMAKANPLVEPKAFVQGGFQYDFTGWSLRKGDAEPTWAKDGQLPVLESGSGGFGGGYITGSDNEYRGPSYFATYDKTPLAANVEFYNGDELVVRAENVDAASTLTQCFNATGADRPVAAQAGKAFNGNWAPDGSEAGYNDTVAALIERDGLFMRAGEDGYEPVTIKVRACFGDAAYYKASFYETAEGSAEKEPLNQWTDADGKAANYVYVAEGGTVAGTGSAPRNPGRMGSYFFGWSTSADGAGAFSVDETPVTGDVDLYAVFKPIQVGGLASGVQADVGSAYMADAAEVGAASVRLEVAASGKPDANIAEAGSYEAGSYSVSVVARSEDGSESAVPSWNNGIRLTLPVGEEFAKAGNKVVVRWLKADGTVGTSAEKEITAAGAQAQGMATQASSAYGTVDVSIDGIAASAAGGNLAVYARPTNEQLAAGQAASSAHDRLKAAYDKYSKASYTDAGWAELQGAYQTAYDNIDNSSSAEQVEESLKAGLAAMAAVDADHSDEVQRAKSEGLLALASAYAAYEKSDYADAGWAQLLAAYRTALSNVSAADSAAAALAAARDGIAAMSAVEPAAAQAASGSQSKPASTTASTSSGVASATRASVGTQGTGASLINRDASTGLNSSGATETVLGATLRNVTYNEAAELGVKGIEDTGVVVGSVDPDGAFGRAGLREGDAILFADGIDVLTIGALVEQLAGHEPGDVVQLEVMRDGELVTVPLTLSEEDVAAMREADDREKALAAEAAAGSGIGAVDNGYYTGGDQADEAGIPWWVWVVAAAAVIAVAGAAAWLVLRGRKGPEGRDGADGGEGQLPGEISFA